MKNETHRQRQNGGVTTAPTPVDGNDKQVYLECLLLIERLHRRFLDVIKLELDRLGIKDVNNVQSLILYNIGEAEMTVGELTSRGYYLRFQRLLQSSRSSSRMAISNRSARRMTGAPCASGCRRRVSISTAASTPCTTSTSPRCIPADITAGELAAVNETLTKLEQFWSNQIRYGAR